jgi:hypothetical protein
MAKKVEAWSRGCDDQSNPSRGHTELQCLVMVTIMNIMKGSSEKVLQVKAKVNKCRTLASCERHSGQHGEGYDGTPGLCFTSLNSMDNILLPDTVFNSIPCSLLGSSSTRDA